MTDNFVIMVFFSMVVTLLQKQFYFKSVST